MGIEDSKIEVVPRLALVEERRADLKNQVRAMTKALFKERGRNTLMPHMLPVVKSFNEDIDLGWYDDHESDPLGVFRDYFLYDFYPEEHAAEEEARASRELEEIIKAGPVPTVPESLDSTIPFNLGESMAEDFSEKIVVKEELRSGGRTSLI